MWTLNIEVQGSTCSDLRPPHSDSECNTVWGYRLETSQNSGMAMLSGAYADGAAGQYVGWGVSWVGLGWGGVVDREEIESHLIADVAHGVENGCTLCFVAHLQPQQTTCPQCHPIPYCCSVAAAPTRIRMLCMRLSQETSTTVIPSRSETLNPRLRPLPTVGLTIIHSKRMGGLSVRDR